MDDLARMRDAVVVAVPQLAAALAQTAPRRPPGPPATGLLLSGQFGGSGGAQEGGAVAAVEEPLGLLPGGEARVALTLCMSRSSRVTAVEKKERVT